MYVCMCVYVSMYVCMYFCMYICLHACIQLSLSPYLSTYLSRMSSLLPFSCVSEKASLANVTLHTCAHTHTHKNTHTHKYTHTHKHTHTHTNKRTHSRTNARARSPSLLPPSPLPSLFSFSLLLHLSVVFAHGHHHAWPAAKRMGVTSSQSVVPLISSISSNLSTSSRRHNCSR